MEDLAILALDFAFEMGACLVAGLIERQPGKRAKTSRPAKASSQPAKQRPQQLELLRQPRAAQETCGR